MSTTKINYNHHHENINNDHYLNSQDGCLLSGGGGLHEYVRRSCVQLRQHQSSGKKMKKRVKWKTWQVCFLQSLRKLEPKLLFL